MIKMGTGVRDEYKIVIILVHPLDKIIRVVTSVVHYTHSVLTELVKYVFLLPNSNNFATAVMQCSS